MKKSLLLLFLLINALGLQAQELEIVGNLVRSKDLKKIVFEGDSVCVHRNSDKLDWGELPMGTKVDSLYFAKCEEWFLKHFTKIVYEDQELQEFMSDRASRRYCNFWFTLIFERTTRKVVGISFVFSQIKVENEWVSIMNAVHFEKACMLYEVIKNKEGDFLQYFIPDPEKSQTRHIAVSFDLEKIISKGKLVEYRDSISKVPTGEQSN